MTKHRDDPGDATSYEDRSLSRGLTTGGTSATVIETSFIGPRSDRVATVQSAYGWAISANVVAAASAVMAAVFIAQLGRRLATLADG